MPGTTTPLPNGLPRLCVMQMRLPSSSRDRERRGVPGVLAGGGLHPLLGRAGDRLAVAHTRAQTLDMLVAEQARQFLRRRIVVLMRTPAARRIAR